MIKAAVINDTGGKGHYGCDLVMDRLRDGLARAGATELWSHPVGVDWRPLEDQILARPPVDVVVVNGEGSIHHAASRPRARYLPAIAPFAKERLKAKVYLINATVCDIDDAVADDLRAFDGIFVRDRGSQRVLADYGLASKFVGDLTLGADLQTVDARKGVCVTDSVVSEAASELESAATAHGWHRQVMHDRKRAKQTRNTFWSKMPWKPRDNDFRTFARLLSSHELVVTGRYHTVTMCIATRTPFVALESNTPKISWLLDDVFGERSRVIEPAALRSLSTAAYANWKEQESRALEDAVSAARSGAAAMFMEICSAPSTA